MLHHSTRVFSKIDEYVASLLGCESTRKKKTLSCIENLALLNEESCPILEDIEVTN
jgi:hypothetical protein